MRHSGLLLVILLGGCATHTIRPLKPLELATGQFPNAVTASMTGSLLYERNCLLFRDEQNRADILPIWPLGSTFNGTEVIFHSAGKADQRVAINEEVLIEGQPSAWSLLTAPYYVRFQHQCGGRPFLVSAVRPAN